MDKKKMVVWVTKQNAAMTERIKTTAKRDARHHLSEAVKALMVYTSYEDDAGYKADFAELIRDLKRARKYIQV